jgi:hypothetical protein
MFGITRKTKPIPKTTNTERTIGTKAELRKGIGKTFNINIDGKACSLTELMDVLDEEFDNNCADEVKFNFSGDYPTLKKHLEKYPSNGGIDYQVSNKVKVTNQGDKFSKSYTVIIRKRHE